MIFTDHKTRNEKILGALKAIIRPTPAQRKNQKLKLDHSIEKFQRGIDKFGEAMDELDKGLKAGRPDTDPVEMVFGRRDKKSKKKAWTSNPETTIFGKPDKDKYKALLG